MADEIDAGKLEIDLSGVIGDNEKLLESITGVRKGMSDLRKETKNLQDASEDQRKEYVSLDSELRALNQQYNQNKKILADATAGVTGLTEALERENKNTRDAKKNNKELAAMRDLVDTSTKEGAKAVEDINKKMSDNNKFIQSNKAGYEGLRGAIDKTIPGLGGMIDGIKGGTKAALAFIATPLGAVLAIIVGALTAVTTALTKTQGGMDLVNKVMTVGGAIMDVMIGRIAKLGTGLIKLISGNLDGLDDLKDAFTGVAEEVEKTVEGASKLADMEVAVRRMAIATERSVALLEKEAAMYRGIEADATRSFAEREDAAKKAMNAEMERARQLQVLAEQELKVIETRNKRLREQGLFTDDHWRAEVEARNKVTQAEAEMIAKELENAQIRRQLVQDRLERDLDILIDGADNQKTINEQIIADDRYTLEERRKLLDETVSFMDATFEKQMQTIQKFTGKRIDADELLKESDAEVLNQKIRSYGLSEIIEGRLLEVVRERRMAEQDLTVAAMDLDEEEKETKERNAREAAQVEMRAIQQTRSAERAAQQTEAIERRAAFQTELEEMEAHNESLKNIELAKVNFIEKQSIKALEQESKRRELEIKDSKDSAELKQAQLALLEAETQDQLTEITKQATEERAAIEEAEKQRRMQMAEEIINTSTSVLNKLSEINQAQLDKRMEKLDKEKQAIIEKYDEEIEKAAGNADEVAKLEQQKADAIAGVDERAAEAQKKFQKKQEKIMKAQAILDAVSFTLKAGAQFGIPGLIVGGIMSIALLEALGVTKLGKFLKRIKRLVNKFGGKKDKKALKEETESIGGFATGTDRVRGPGTRTSDSILARLSRDEGVAHAKANMDWYPGLVGAMNAGRVDQWFSANMDTSSMNKRLDNINHTLKSKKTLVNVNVGGQDNSYLYREYGYRR